METIGNAPGVPVASNPTEALGFTGFIYRKLIGPQLPAHPSIKREEALTQALTEALEALRIVRDLRVMAKDHLEFLSSQQASLSKIRDPRGGFDNATERQSGRVIDSFYTQQAIALGERVLKNIEDQIISGRTQVAFLQAQEDGLMRAVTELEGVINPRLRIPIEVWQCIFRACIETEPDTVNVQNARNPYDQASALFCVCRKWRDAMLLYGPIWSNISLRSFQTRRLAGLMELHVGNLSSNRSLTLHLPSAPMRATISAYSAEFTFPQFEGEADTGDAFYDASRVDSLTLLSSEMLSCRIVLKTWNLRSLSCKDVIPILAPSAAKHVTKLTILGTHSSLAMVPDSVPLSSLLKALPALVELNLADLYGDGITRQLVVPQHLKKQLRCVRTTLDVLMVNGNNLVISPHLQTLGIYLCCGVATFSAVESNFILPLGSLHRITHLELYTYYGHQLLNSRHIVSLFQDLQGLRTLLLEGPHFTALLEAVADKVDLVLPLKEVTLRHCDVDGVVIAAFLSRITVVGSSEVPPTSAPLEKLVLDHCTCITKDQCDMIAGFTSALAIYC